MSEQFSVSNIPIRRASGGRMSHQPLYDALTENVGKAVQFDGLSIEQRKRVMNRVIARFRNGEYRVRVSGISNMGTPLHIWLERKQAVNS